MEGIAILLILVVEPEIHYAELLPLDCGHCIIKLAQIHALLAFVGSHLEKRHVLSLWTINIIVLCSKLGSVLEVHERLLNVNYLSIVLDLHEGVWNEEGHAQ